MRPPCNCYYGYDCTKTTVCAVESAVEDATEQMQGVTEAATTYVHHLIAEHHGQGRPHLLKAARKNLIEEVEAYEVWEKGL